MTRAGGADGALRALRGRRGGTVLTTATIAAMLWARGDFLRSFFRLPPEAAASRSAPAAFAAGRTPIVIILTDGLREDIAGNPDWMPFVNRRLRPRAAYGTAETWIITNTPAGIRSILTGTHRSLLPELPGLPGRPNADSVLLRAKKAGYEVDVVGGYDHEWPATYRGHYTRAFLYPFRGAASKPKDDAAVDHLREVASTPGRKIVFLHFWDHETLGHRLGIDAPAYREAILALDGRIARTVGIFGPGATYLIVSDHGVLRGGGHGGDSPVERNAPFLLLGPGIRPGGPLRIQQIDLSATLAELAGVRRPFGSLGRPVVEVLASSAAARARILYRHLLELRGTLKWLGLKKDWTGAAVAAKTMIAKGRFPQAQALMDRFFERVQAGADLPHASSRAYELLAVLVLLCALWSARVWSPSAAATLVVLWAALAAIPAAESVPFSWLLGAAVLTLAWASRRSAARLIAFAAAGLYWTYVLSSLGGSDAVHFVDAAGFFRGQGAAVAFSATVLLAGAYAASPRAALAAAAAMAAAQATHSWGGEGAHRAAVALFAAAALALPFWRMPARRRAFALAAAGLCFLRVFGGDVELMILLPPAVLIWAACAGAAPERPGPAPVPLAMLALFWCALRAASWAPAFGNVNFNPGYWASSVRLSVGWIGSVVVLRYLAAFLCAAAPVSLEADLESFLIYAVFLDAGVVAYTCVNGLGGAAGLDGDFLWWVGLLLFNGLFVSFRLLAAEKSFRPRAFCRIPRCSFRAS